MHLFHTIQYGRKSTLPYYLGFLATISKAFQLAFLNTLALVTFNYLGYLCVKLESGKK